MCPLHSELTAVISNGEKRRFRILNQQLYLWQEDCLRSWFQHNCRGIIQAVTGSGKTSIAIAAMERLHMLYGSAFSVKIVVPQTALAAQWSAALREIGGLQREEIGFFYSSRKDKAEHFCTIYVINSARYTLARHILTDLENGNHVFLIADECHHYASQENRKIFDFLPRLKDYSARFFSMGLSATPEAIGFREYLIPALGDLFYQYTFKDAAENQTINPFVICNISLPFDTDEADQYQSFTNRITFLKRKLYKQLPRLRDLDAKNLIHTLRRLSMERNDSEIGETASALLNCYAARKAVVYEANARIDSVIHLVQCLDTQDRIMIFGERIRQAETICAIFNELLPGQVGMYHSQQDKIVNQAVLEHYRNQEIRILITCKALDEGLDIPSTNIGIVLSSSSQERQRIQRLGRILRKSGDTLSTLYYFYIEGTTEPCSYMESLENTPLFLSYHTDEHRFRHPYYDQLADAALSHLILEGAEQNVQMEFRRCADLGLCRTDWLRKSEEIQTKIQTSPSIQEKNYWLTMKLLQAEHEKRHGR